MNTGPNPATPGDMPSLEDATFLEGIAKGFAAVKVKPKGNTASQISAAQQGTHQFQERASRLTAIATRIRAHWAYTHRPLAP